MKVGNFNINDYLEKLNEEISVDGGIKGDNKEGLIIPEINKKFYSWLKKEYDKAKVEVKVEIKMGGIKFEPGYDLQTDLKSVKDFKPGMYGQVKTSDTPGNTPSTKKEKSESSPEKPKWKKEKSESSPEKPKWKKEKPTIKGEVKTIEKEEEKEEKDKKKVNESWIILKEGKEKLENDTLKYLQNLPMTMKPLIKDLPYVRKIQVDPQLEIILESLSIVKFQTYENLLESSKGIPYPTFYIANVEIENEESTSYLIDPSGYDYPRYIAELI